MKARMLIAVAVLAVGVSQLQAATIAVTSTADNGPGSLRNALASAANGDTIDASGVSGTILLTNGELLVTNSVDIVGPGPDLLAINGNYTSRTVNPNRVFHTGSNTVVTISSLTITNGLIFFGSGGGIWNDHATLMVSNVLLSGNSAVTLEYVIVSGNSVNTDPAGGGIWNDHATLTVNTCTLSGNFANDGGGAIYNDAVGGTASVLITNSTLSGNDASYGGGIDNEGSGGTASVQIVDSTLSGNSAGSGGGVCNLGNDNGNATIQIVNSTFSSNSAGYGGGIENVVSLGNDDYGGTASTQITNSTLSGNAAYYGGGIDNDGAGGTASAQIVDSTLSGNDAYNGGGINNKTAPLRIVNSTLSGNSAITGGGIFNYGPIGGTAAVQIVNSTLSDNSATNGGGIYNTSRANLEIGSTILNAGALGVNITDVRWDGATVTSLGYNLSSDDVGVGFLTATGDQINTNPMLDPAGLRDNGGPTLTIALLCGSPAIDQGYNFSGAATDQRGPGFVRTFDDCAMPNAPGGDGTDIGAYEVQRGECPHPPIMSCPTNQSVNASSPAGARVNYPTPEASNGCPISVVCNPPNGSLFAIGNTTVSCLATDNEGNEATCSFTVHVKGATEQIDDLIALVQALNLKPWTTYILTGELQSASNALRRDYTRAACIDLDAFIFEVDVQTWWGQIWPPSRARLLTRNAQRIQNVLGCYDGFGPGHY